MNVVSNFAFWICSFEWPVGVVGAWRYGVMSSPNAVRFSRDGDQFHYLWAARRCLRLLPRTSDVVAISVEGASNVESAQREEIEPGEQVIDLAEYYGSEELRASEFVNYVQLKHSTKNAGMPW